MNVCKTKDNETRIHICDTQRERAQERAHAREKSAREKAREKAVRIPDSRPGIMWTCIVRVTRIMSIVSEEKEYSKHGACDMIL